MTTLAKLRVNIKKVSIEADKLKLQVTEVEQQLESVIKDLKTNPLGNKKEK